uniref:Z band alternatively spliced PDZ-motif protein 52, isoform X n=1 Tax=Drosophila melanogaster TaxID=7227 RepID=A0A126GUN6_DROME|nr:Z band alternatively spliced PDZ-motif protein 52, isoform X [Drosophila melanogaster]ALI30180.1 Z band alternatively spliced PDZ-motif protein 52, isoform X [Drosophila melanogaster]|eukprot:NP_001303350.1 Z band alternatively spliced PDZ-motif protein 52, isoform X [Drosophila melanogaster]
MAQPQLLQIKLSRFDAQPWGFRLQGGTDFAQPLLVQKVNAGSLSEQAGLQPGDAVVKINDVDVFNLRHKDAQDIVVRSGNNFVITVQRGGSTWRPHVTPTGNVPQPNSPYLQTVTKTSLAHKQQDSQHIGCGYNNAARPFSNGGDGGVKSIVNKQYNTPVGIYSDESIAETLSAQAEVLAGGVLGVNFKKNEKEYQGDRSEVLKFLREEETGQSTPEPHSPANFYWTQSHAIGGNERRTPLHHQHQQPQQDERIGVPLQSNTLAPEATHRPSLPVAPKDNEEQARQDQQEQPDPRIIVLPICPGLQGPEYKAEMEAAAAALATDQDGRPRPLAASGHPACQLCGVGIVGVFVRIKDKNLHVECFKCATCGTSLKNQGYYNFNNKLYCDIHAKQAAINNPPTGTEGYVPVPIKPNTKLSASTISSALNSHGYGGHSNGYSNGNSTPAPAPVNQGYARPFGAAAPKSPVSYPPQQQQQSPRPAPGGQNPYATLPRSNVGQQGGEAVEELQPEFEEEDCYEMDIEVALAASRQSQRGSSFTWPPPQDDSHLAPTAAPLYIPPPETQHVVVSNPVQQVPPLPPGGATARLDPQPVVGTSANGAPQWQSYSAPQLTTASARQLAEQESSSDSYTSTSTTTTTTSEEYQRMYAAQVQAYQMQEQSGSEFDYQVDYASTQDSVQDYPSGRRSAQECVDSLAVPLSTYKLVDMVREVTPSPVTTPTQTPAPAAPTTRRVVFNDEPEIKELPQLPAELETIPEASEAVEDREGLVIEQRCQILESERKFQPTPEIKIEIAPVRQIPPTKIPNPMPKEWINPMIRVLTTAPEVPFHLVECPFPRPCGDDFEAEAAAAEAAKTQEVPEPLPPQVSAAPPATVSVEPSPAPLRESPPRGSRLSQAMVTAPEFELKFAPPADQGIPLPEETEPYMPPPIDTKPYLREDYRPKSPFVSALTTAPDRPFEGHFDKDVPIHMIDLPTPKEHLSMCDALCTAPERGYTPLNPENAMHRVDEEQKQQELKKREFQVLDHEEELGIRPEPPQSVEYYETRRDQPRKSSAFAAMQAFQPSREPLSSNTVSNAGSVADTPRASIVSALKEETDLEYQKYLKAQQRNQKRLDYFHQKEEELSGLQGQQLTQLQRELSNQQQNLLSQQQLQQSKLLQLQQCVQSQELQQQVQHLTQKSQQQPPQANQQQQQQQQQRGTQQQQHSQVTQRTQQQQQQVPQQVTQQQQQEHSLLSQTTLAETQTLQANAQSQSSASYSSKATACSNSSSTVPPANTSTAFAPAPAPAPTSIPVRPSAIAVQSSYCSSQFDVHELIEETAEELEHSEVLFPPPSPLSHLTKQGKAVQSGLHKADSIPKYQRNWTVLPTQSPIRTPEPQELRENVPLAFVDAPKAPVTSDSSTVHRPIAQVAAPTTVVAPSREREKERRPQLSVPIIVEDRSGPVTMAFQPLDELVRPDQALTPTRPYTPSLTNKPAPIVPFYQTEEKLVFEECSATHARNYNELNASPFPDRTRSPAPGPPPNPLNAIRAPRMKEPETKSNILSVSGGPRLQTGSITTGQSYQGQLLAHSEQSSQSASQSYNQQPERITEQRVGNLNIQQREQSSQLQQQAQSQTQSQTRSQVGNTQIERRRKVTEEFERTQSAKTIEIRTGSQSVSQSKAQSQSISQAQTQAQSQSQNQSDTERRSSYGKTGFVASQAKRLSCMEEEISSLTSQSQAISARASALGEGCFPNLRSPTFDSKFPLKPAPAESIVPGYATVPAATKMLTAPPPGFLQQQQQQQQRSAFSGYQATTSSVQQSSFASSSKATTSSLSSSSASASASASVARSSQSLTQASAITTTTNNQATTAYRSSNGSITKPNLASRPSIASITAPGSASAPAPVPSAAPTKATAPFKAPIVPKSVIANAVNAAAPPAPAVFPPDLSDLNLNSNVDNSPGAGGKSAGAFGATSAPKRGRGILNKAAGPGVRIPLCNSCNVQIRGPFITALGRIWCPDHFICVNGNCRRPLQDIGFVEEKGDLYCEYCFEKYLAPTCSKCAGKIKGDCLNAIGKHFHPECFTCGQCGKIFGNRPFFLEDGNAYCEADWNELFTTKCFACGFPVEAGDRWVEALNHNYHSQCFNCTFCKQNLEGQSFYNKGGRPFCKNHAR